MGHFSVAALAIPDEGTRLPAQQRSSPGKASTEATEQNDVAPLEKSLAIRIVERHRNTGRRRVPVLVEVDKDLFPFHAEVTDGRVDDADVGLMENHEINVLW